MGYGIEIFDELGNKLIEENTMIPRIKYGKFGYVSSIEVDLSGTYTLELVQPWAFDDVYGGYIPTITRVGNGVEIGKVLTGYGPDAFGTNFIIIALS